MGKYKRLQFKSISNLAKVFNFGKIVKQNPLGDGPIIIKIGLLALSVLY